VALKKSHHWVNQIGEQDRKSKDYDDTPSDIDDGQHHCEQQCGQQYVQSAAIRERHIRHPGDSRYWA
jgi:hypothetical protein